MRNYRQDIKDTLIEKELSFADFWSNGIKKILYYSKSGYVGIAHIEGKNWKEILTKVENI